MNVRVAAAPPLHRSELPLLTRRALGMLPPMTDEQVEHVLDEQRTGNAITVAVVAFGFPRRAP